MAYDVEIPDEKWFRENSSKIPGHEHDFDDPEIEESQPDKLQLEVGQPKGNKFPKGDKVAEILVNLTLDSSVELYLDQLGEPHVSLPEKPVTAFPIKSSTFRRWLAGKYWEEFRKGFSGDAFQTVVATLEGKAFHEGQTLELYNRIARVDDAIYYDLGDNVKVVRIDRNGWEVTGYPNVPVKFRRFNHQMVQVEPVKGGKLKDVLQFINLKSETDQLLFLTYLPTVCIPDIPRAALIQTGDQGSAKSTGLRIARSLIDPSRVELLDPISDLKELAQAANHHYCLYLDNLSYLRDELSDALSRLVTGIGFTKRKLFSDEDDIVFKQKVAVGMSGITLVATKPDLLERSLILTYDLISEDKRQSEEELWSKFAVLKPQILGALFDILSKTLVIKPELKFSRLPRMADYAKYATAAAVALGFTQESFLRAFYRNTSRQNETALESSTTAYAIRQFMFDKESWEGLASELYALLKEVVEGSKQQIGGEGGFPKAANYLWKRISVIRPNLISIGITPTRSENSTGTLITLTKTVQEGKIAAITSTTAIENSGADTDSRHEMATVATLAVKTTPLDNKNIKYAELNHEVNLITTAEKIFGVKAEENSDENFK